MDWDQALLEWRRRGKDIDKGCIYQTYNGVWRQFVFDESEEEGLDFTLPCIISIVIGSYAAEQSIST